MFELPSQINSLQRKKLYLANAVTHARVHHSDTGTDPVIFTNQVRTYIQCSIDYTLLLYIHALLHNVA